MNNLNCKITVKNTDMENNSISGESWYVNVYFLLYKISIDIAHASNFENISDDVNQIYPMCLDQSNCRLLQKELDRNDISITNKIYQGVINHIVGIMSDPIGNYLFQKLLDLIDEKQRFNILINCRSFLLEISNNPYGTRSVQKLIDVIETDAEIKIISEAFQDYVVEMIKNLHGNHVIRKCIKKINFNNKNQFIYDAISANCVEVAIGIYGCCIFKDCIDHGSIEQKLQLIDAVDSNIMVLIQDPYGNYVIQYIIDLKLDPTFPTKITKKIIGKIYHFSKQKFSSNVIEKCLKEGDSDCIKRIMNELLFNPNIRMSKLKPYSPSLIEKRAQDQLIELLLDNFGNYVIQTCLNEAITKANKEYNLMIKLLLPVYNQFKHTIYGKKIIHHLGIVNK